jgi:hypothetical protein
MEDVCHSFGHTRHGSARLNPVWPNPYLNLNDHRARPGHHNVL